MSHFDNKVGVCYKSCGRLATSEWELAGLRLISKMRDGLQKYQ